MNISFCNKLSCNVQMSNLPVQDPYKMKTLCLKWIKIEGYMERNIKNTTSNYKFSQIFGYKGANEPVQEEDIITALKFDKQGRFIALGDKAGRIIVFQNSEPTDKAPHKLEYFTQFQSHFREFDPLRSVDVDEEIVDLSWLNQQGKYLKLATTNSRSIKLWKIYEKFDKRVVRSAGKELNMPKLENVEANYAAELQKAFPTKHINPILQFSQSSHEQYLLSTDEAQSFLWDFERPDRPYVVCDLGEASSKADDRQTITCCQMHPKSDNLFLYGMSKGSLKLGDMRISASNDANSTCYKSASTAQKNYLLGLISNISSATFTSNGKYMVSRDFLSVKIWDICNSKKPLSCIMLNEALKSKLCEMVQNEAIYDEFGVAVSADNNTILTGSYNNTFHLMDFESANSQYELSYKKSTICRSPKSAPLTKIDYDRKVLVGHFNPTRNMFAVASLNCFFTYSL